MSNVSRKLEGSAGPKSQNGKMNFNEVYQYSNSILSFNSTCVLRSENRHFVVALTWSLGRICATDWILKYTPTASRLIQTTDTIHKRLKSDAQCLARDYATSDVCSTQELLPYLQGPHDVISVLETQKVSKNKLLGLEPSKLMLQYPQYLAELGILLQAGIRPWLLGIVVHLE